jgi:predicted nucleic acid-binding Zn ribbon protein
MFDGAKIVVGGVLVTVWSQNPLLDFVLNVSKQSGEVLDDERTKYKGLGLVVKSSKVDASGFRIELNGSLPNFLNEGVQTFDQLTIHGMEQTLMKLHQELGIVANEAVLLNAEICINVFCRDGVTQVLNAIKGHFDNSNMSRNDEPQFKGVRFERTQYALKIYDKGRHIGKAGSNMLRVELKLKKSEILQKYGIRYLSDLSDPGKVEPLIKLLIEKLQDVIMIDSLSDSLNEKERLQFQAWGNTDYWKANFPERKNRTQKTNERAKFEGLLQRYGLDSIKQSLMKNLCEVWAASMESKEPFLRQGLTENKNIRSTKSSDTLTIKIKWQSVTNYIYNSLINREKAILSKNGKNDKKAVANGVESGRRCVVCGIDISMKSKTAKVCSKKCSNIKSGENRTEKERQKRTIEETVLSFIFAENVTFKNIHIVTKCGGRNFFKITKSKFRTFTTAEIKSVHLLSVRIERKDYVLSRQRARRLLVYLAGESHTTVKRQE